MSKLFDTLEQIKRNESAQISGSASGKYPKKSGKAGINKTFLVVILLAVVSGTVYFLPPGFLGKNRQSADKDYLAGPGAIPPSAAVRSVARPAPAPNVSDKDINGLNDTGFRYVVNNDHWRGIFVFSTILDRYPDTIEPMINLGVSLAELGLVEPAKRYLRQAASLDRNHPGLRKNIDILKKAGIVDDDFLDTVHDENG